MSRYKFEITTDSPEDAEWKNILINGEKTPYETNILGDVRHVNKKKNNIQIDNTLFRKYNKQAYTIHTCTKRVIHISKRRLMAALFIPIPDNLKDFSQCNLSVNLKFPNLPVLSVDNMYWGICQARYFKVKTYRNRLNFRQIRKICKYFKIGCMSQSKIAEIMGVSTPTINRLYNRKTYTEITKKYEW